MTETDPAATEEGPNDTITVEDLRTLVRDRSLMLTCVWAITPEGTHVPQYKIIPGQPHTYSIIDGEAVLDEVLGDDWDTSEDPASQLARLPDDALAELAIDLACAQEEEHGEIAAEWEEAFGYERDEDGEPVSPHGYTPDPNEPHPAPPPPLPDTGECPF